MPRRIDRYQLVRPLGKGGTASVFLARDPQGREVALKLLDPGRDPERLRREGELIARLDHPHVLKVHTAGVHDGRPYLVCPVIEDARPLDEVARSLPLAERIGLLRQAASGLAAAHAAGIVHRDVKPENLLVDRHGVVRVTDFGCGTSQGASRLTRTGAFLGTPFFMAPEQLNTQREAIGPWTDVWALGVVLHQLLTGELPFPGPSLPLLMSQVLGGAPRPAAAPAPLAQLCARALAHEPAERPADASAFLDALEAWQRGDATVDSSRAGFVLAAGVVSLGAVLAGGIVAAAGRPLPPPPPPPSSPPRAATSEPQPPAPSPAATLDPLVPGALRLAQQRLAQDDGAGAEPEFAFAHAKSPPRSPERRAAADGLAQVWSARLEDHMVQTGELDLDLCGRVLALEPELGAPARAFAHDRLLRCARWAELGSRLTEAVPLYRAALAMIDAPEPALVVEAAVLAYAEDEPELTRELLTRLPESAARLALEAELALDAGDLGAAAGLLARAKAPHWLALRARARLLATREQPAAALDVAEDALAASPSDPQAMLLTARLRLATGDALGAASLSRELDVRRRSSACYRLMAQAYEALDDWHEVAVALRKLIGRNPDRPALTVETAEARWRAREVDEAIEELLLLDLIELEPELRRRVGALCAAMEVAADDHVQPRRTRAVCAMATGRWVEALAVLGAEPEAPAVRWMRGRCHLALGDLAAAVTDLEAAAAQAPRSVWPHVYLARIHALRGDREALASAQAAALERAAGSNERRIELLLERARLPRAE